MSEFLTKDIKAVVFDFDDTLVGTHSAIWDLHRHIAKTYYGIELQDEVIRMHWGRPLTDLARHYYQTEEIDEAIAKIVHHQMDFPKAKFEHSNAVTCQLKIGGHIVGMVTATSKPILVKDAVWVGLPLENFDYLQTAEDSLLHKPDPRVFDPMFIWMAERDVAPQNILYVGDGLHDLVAATQAGLKFLGVTTGLVSAAEFADNGAVSIPNLSSLK